MPSQVTTSGTSQDGGGSRWSWLLPAGTFLAGCVLGGVVVGVGAVGGDDEPAAPQAATAEAQAEAGGDEAAGGEPADGDDSGLYVRVPESCVQTADDASTLVEHVDRVVAAVADLEPERLRQTVDEVQQIRDDVQDVAEQCRAAAAQQLQGADDDAAPATPAS